MKATELLKQDHDEVKELFSKYEQADPGSQEAKDIAGTIIVELTMHTQVEEEFFYPAVQDADAALVPIVGEAIQEHQTVDALIDELMEMKGEDPEYAEKMHELISNVKHHVEEEEGQLFPKAEKALGSKLEDIGRQMNNRKQEIQKAA